MYAKGLYFLTDQDARPQGSAHPQAHLWDNGPSAAAELRRLLEIRKTALGRFGELNIPTGTPLVYELDAQLQPVASRYLGDAAAVKARAEAVARQTETKK